MTSCFRHFSRKLKYICFFSCCKKKGLNGNGHGNEKNNNIINNKKKYKRDDKLISRYDDNRNNNNDISYLDNITYKDTIAFIPPILYGKVIKVYDGDTITIAARLPFNGSPIYRFSVRLAHIDSPEIKGESKMENRLAIVSRDALHKLIFGKIIELKNNGKEKYGRLLADLYYNGLYVNQWMLDNKYAVMYDGGKKIRPSEWN